MAPHKVLGLAPGASTDQIRTAYRLLGLKAHPDGATPDLDRFREISAAYQALVKGVAFEPERISNKRALDVFAEAMHELGVELARLGYDEVFIYRALHEEGCPADLATSAAREATYSAPRQRDKAKSSWEFARGAPMPLLEPTPRSGTGFAVKMLLLGAIVCGSLAALAWFLPNTLERVTNAIAPLRAPLTLPEGLSGSMQPSSPAAYPKPAAPASEAAPPPRPRIVQPRPAQSPGADSCATDRDCPEGSRCLRASVHEPWSCRAR